MAKITLTESKSKFDIPDYIKFKISKDENRPILQIFDNNTPAYLIYACLTKIDRHWFIRVTEYRKGGTFNPTHDQVIGVTAKIEDLADKLYSSAREFAQKYAEEERSRF